MKVTISYPARNLVKEFASGREAAAWVATWQEKKLPVADLVIDSPVPLGFFAPHIPGPCADLMGRLYERFPVVPRVHWIDARHRLVSSSGRTSFERARNGGISHITISAGTLLSDNIETILHEWAHAITYTIHGRKFEHHGRIFYRTLFVLFQEYLGPKGSPVFEKACRREWNYMSSSRYYYAEMFEDLGMLREYHGPDYGRDVIEELFGSL